MTRSALTSILCAAALAACGVVTPAGGRDRDRDGFGVSIDCNDDDRTVFPGAAERPYDGIDQDCDGKDLDDLDGDGHAALEAGGDDCNDADPAVHPGAVDVCGDGLNQDCSGGDLLCIDFDADDDGYTPAQGDCDDSDPAVGPHAAEVVYNRIDDDCDPFSKDDDLDGDHFDKNEGGDCDDTKAQVHPAADEVPYDGVDQDCSGRDLTDVDGDGHDSDALTGGDDCDDVRPDVHPGAAEVCGDGADNDCAGDGDAACPAGDVDADGDHFSPSTGGDCDDDDEHVFPGAPEEPYDGEDQDCDGTDLTDVDRDGHDADASYYPSDGAAAGDDCDDTRPDVHPGLHEVPFNHIDENCDGSDFAGYPSSVNESEGSQPAVAYGGGAYLVVYSVVIPDGVAAGIYAQRLDTNGNPVGDPLSVRGGASSPRVAFDGNRFLVVYQVGGGAGERDVYGRFVEPDGTVEPSDFPISADSGEYEELPDVTFGAFGGGQYLVAWYDDELGEIDAATVTTGGAVSEKHRVSNPSSAFAARPAVGSGGGAFLVAWEENTAENGVDVFARIVGADGTATANPTDLAALPGDQRQPAVGFDGQRFLVAFTTDRPAGGVDLLGRFVTTAGVPAAEPLVISGAPGARSRPAVAYFAGAYLVAWQDARWVWGPTIYGQRLSAGGAPVGEEASINWALVASAEEMENLDAFGGLATDGTSALLVWARVQRYPPVPTLRAQLVTP